MDRDACYNLFQKKVVKFSSDLCEAKEETGGKSTHQASRYFNHSENSIVFA